MTKDNNADSKRFADIIKAMGQANSSAAKLLWVLMGEGIKKYEPVINLKTYKALLPYKTRSYYSSDGADDLQVYLDLAKDLSFLKSVIGEGNHYVFDGQISFTFPKWLSDYIVKNPFKIEE